MSRYFEKSFIRGQRLAAMTGTLLCLLLLPLLGDHLTPAAQAQAKQSGWALLIGINHYDAADITPLQFAEADARGMAKTLSDVCGIPTNHILVLTSDGKDKLRASRANVVYWLSRFKSIVQPDDTLVFFFAGHGMSMDKESYLLTVDAIAENADNLEDSAIKVSHLRSLLEQIPAARKLVALDACRNDPRAGRGAGDNKLTDSMARGLMLRSAPTATVAHVEVAATIFACKVGERSYEWPEKGHGFFTYFLMSALRGAAKTNNGTITLGSLLDYVQLQMPQEMKLWKGAAIQTPWAEISGSLAGKWVLAGTGVPADMAPSVPMEEPSAGLTSPSVGADAPTGLTSQSTTSEEPGPTGSRDVVGRYLGFKHPEKYHCEFRTDGTLDMLGISGKHIGQWEWTDKPAGKFRFRWTDPGEHPSRWFEWQVSKSGKGIVDPDTGALYFVRQDHQSY